MKYIITESQYNKAIDRFITFELEPHEVKTSKKYPDSIFWVKDGEVIAEIENSEYFYLDYNIWDKISDLFSLEYDDTQSVIKHWLEEHYKLGELTPERFASIKSVGLEEHYKLGELTPERLGSFF